ncbi:uncharacterized protein E0L32_010408 [Thyridium curvatum]|uniref:CorA-like transporter domain-containing protein n=1 Tax=Thyridium curvatum TaxID=1093900 RepID=A0A507AKI2_9PEZI|nr:uncharacterized protein E0L32_010408 [Thyridium curvatum]TPX07953.1 hypothetical protein E0L32_010408 [Thyridium curvatum]
MSTSETLVNNPEDLYRFSCDHAGDYPACLLDAGQSGPSVGADIYEMKQRENLWSAKQGQLHLLELYDGQPVHEESCPQSISELQAHFDKNSKDPRYCFAFVEAPHSRAPLNCTIEMFQELATRRRISPTFTSNVTSFGEQTLPKDFNLMTIHHEDNLYARPGELHPLPSLGRSGRELRYCFNIRSVERANSEPGWSWSIRNLAIYHSFDVETGRFFWVGIKANKLIRERIYQAIQRPKFSTVPLSTLEGSFAATLEVLWVILDWTQEHWRGYINNLDEDLRKIVIKAKTAQIDRENNRNHEREHNFVAPIPRTVLSQLSSVATPTISKHSMSTSFFHKIMSIFRKDIEDNMHEMDSFQQSRNPCNGSKADIRDERGILTNLSVLETFTFAELQNLHLIGERINEALLVIELTREIITSITAYYTDTFNSELLPDAIRNNCKSEMAQYQQRMGNIARNLGMRQRQLHCMGRMAQEAKVLFDGILQYRNVQISQLFAQSGFDSSRKMEMIAHKTEEETTSMHVITCVTLLFLPGTFVAAFFQSGVIHLREPETVQDEWILLSGPFALFAAISLSLIQKAPTGGLGYGLAYRGGGGGGGGAWFAGNGSLPG